MVVLALAQSAYGSTWQQLGGDIDGEVAGDQSGFSVSLSSDGTIVAVGARDNDGSFDDAGHVKVYNLTNGDWDQLGSNIEGEAEGDFSGQSVSLSSDGTIVAVGAYKNKGVNGWYSGHVRVHHFINGSWNKLGSDIDGEDSSDYSGNDVSLSSDGTIVAVGAFYNDGVNKSDSGHVKVYNYTNNDWHQVGSDIDGEYAYDYSGISVSLSGDGAIVAIGAWGNNGNSGHVRVYKYIDGAWSQLGSDIDGETGALLGQNIALSSDGIFLAASSTVLEKTKIFQFNTTEKQWYQFGNDINSEFSGDQADDVAISDDGTIVAIGAKFNNDNGTNSGHTRIFSYDNENNTWTQLGIDIDGEAVDDYSGTSVALSSNGETVAIGANFNDDGGDAAGHVRVYRLAAAASPTATPTFFPTKGPTATPTFFPTKGPTVAPTNGFTASPTALPTIKAPEDEDSDDNSAMLGIIIGSVAGGIVVIGGVVYLVMNRPGQSKSDGQPATNLGNLIF